MYNSIFHVFVSSNSHRSQFDLHISHKKNGKHEIQQEYWSLLGLVFQNSWNWIHITFMYPIWQAKFAVAIFRFYFLLFSLKVFKVALFLISVGAMLHNFEPTLSKFRPYCLISVKLLSSLVCDPRLYLRLSLIWNILFIMCVELFYLTFNN